MEKRLRAAAALGYAPVYISLFGSQNYGLAVDCAGYRSDYDYKCVVLPSLSDLVEGKKPVFKTIETPEGQIDIKDIRVFADVLGRMNPSYLECLSADAYLALPGGEGMEAMRALQEKIAKAYPAQGNAAADEIRRIARRMMYDHCADEARSIR